MSDASIKHRLQGSGIADGWAEAPALVTREPIAFNLGVDERTGVIVERGHELEGQSVAGKALVFPGGKGSTASSFSLLQLASLGLAPAAMINLQSDAILVAGAVLAGIPLVHRVPADEIGLIKSGDLLRIDGSTGIVEVLGTDPCG